MDYTSYETEDSCGYPSVYWAGEPYGSRIDLPEALAPLIERLTEYDLMRVQLEEKGGKVEDLQKIINSLNLPFCLRSHFGSHEISLCERPGLVRALQDLSWDLHFDVRQTYTQMPVYYICRTRRDYWSEHSLIVEDYYLSPGYPLQDKRFARLMNMGHEEYYLRLSQFRSSIEGLTGRGRATNGKIDDILYTLGRHLFQSAWHEDQRLGILVADSFHLPEFRQAIELLYLCLSGDLCSLRSALNPMLFTFFGKCYQQPALRRLLSLLSSCNGETLTELPERAGRLYKRLTHTFGRFLATEISWGARGLTLPLWKVVYANVSRLDMVKRSMKGNPAMLEAAGNLRKASAEIIDELLYIGQSDVSEK